MNLTLQTIRFCIDDGIGQLVLTQPPGNPMTISFFEDLEVMIQHILGITSLKALVISGEGRHFSSGASIDQLISLNGDQKKLKGQVEETELYIFLNSNRRLLSFFEEATIPIIAAIRGVCLGSAFELALLSHFRFCSEDAVIGLPESTFGLIPGIGGIRNVSSLAGISVALEISLRGNTFDAFEALKLNLIDVIFPKRQVEEKAIRFAKLVSPRYSKVKKSLYLSRYLTELKGR